MVNQEIQAIANEIKLIVKERLSELNPNKDYTLKEMVGSEAWSLVEGRERSIGTLFVKAVELGEFNLVKVGDNGSNSNIYRLI
jgi:hypothetical protein